MSTPTIPQPTPEQVADAAKASGPQPAGANVPLPPTPPDSGTQLCGADHTYKTRSGESVTKPCVKAKGHTGLHSSRNISDKPDLSVIKLDMLEAEDAPTDELLDILTERVRSAEQLRADSHVLAGYAKWLTAGKPSGANDAIKAGGATRYRVAPENVAAIRVLLRRAENAPDVKALNDGKGVHVRILPPKKNVDGTLHLYFIVVNKSEARQQAGTAASPPATSVPESERPGAVASPPAANPPAGAGARPTPPRK